MTHSVTTSEAGLMSQTVYDVAVVGAGIIGTCIADMHIVDRDGLEDGAE